MPVCMATKQRTKKRTIQDSLQDSIVEIIRKTSTDLPGDIVKMIEKSAEKEAEQSSGRYAMDIIRKNIGLAKTKSQPLCQDTGSILFFIHYPAKVDQELIEKAA